MSYIRKLTAFAAIAILGVVGFHPVKGHAQTYPTKPIRLVVPYTAGGSSDFVARLMAQKMSEGLSQPVTVDNRPGVAGIAGTTSWRKANLMATRWRSSA